MKDNYRPVSILPHVSRIFERCMFRQINKYRDVFLSRHHCGFTKGYKAQRCLLTILEKWRSAVDNKTKKKFWILLADLSKAFDCLSHRLLLAKLHAYGLSIPALRLVYSYLKNRKQRTEITSAYSSWEEILFGVPFYSRLFGIPELENRVKELSYELWRHKTNSGQIVA